MTRSIFALAALSLVACDGDATPTETDAPDTDVEVASNTIVDIASGDPQFTILVEAADRAGLVEVLSSGEFTIFAPTNTAFAAAGIATPEDLSVFTDEEITGILTNHALLGTVSSDMIPATADSVAGLTLFFDTSDGVQVNGATVTTPDVVADNGVIHIIDQVLLPPTIVDSAGHAGLSSLIAAVGGADPSVATLLSEPGEYTVFAPDNAAFTAAESVTATLDQAGLTDVLTYHVYPGTVLAEDVGPPQNSLLANPYGDNVTALFSTQGGAFINGVEITTVDIKATNGTIHVVESVLLPPTIVDHATNAGLTGLLTTVGAATGDLGTTLSGPGPFTVFAPDNDAFDDVPAGLTPEELENILLFHVLDEALTSGDLMAGPVASLNGQDLTIDLTAGVMVEGATVDLADINATNGTVHVIDTVLVPPSAPAPVN